MSLGGLVPLVLVLATAPGLVAAGQVSTGAVLGAVIVAYIAEAHGSPAQHAAGLHTHAIA